MSINLTRDSPLRRIAENSQGVRNEERKPNLTSFKVFVGDYVAPDDPANDPPGTSPSSPPWQNGFYYTDPIWFAHGLDGETDMGGAYDLVTGSPVSGNVAFEMPLEWATEAQPYTSFVVLLDDTGAEEDWLYGIAAQIINQTNGEVRIYWPIVATPYP